MTGPPYDLTFCEIRDTSLVVEWKAPVYAGASELTGYVVEYAKAGSSTWTAANSKAVNQRYLKVTSSKGSVRGPVMGTKADKADTSLSLSSFPTASVCFPAVCSTLCLPVTSSAQVTGLETGGSYVFRVRAENAEGLGVPSGPSDPVIAKALPGKPGHQQDAHFKPGQILNNTNAHTSTGERDEGLSSD